MITGAMFIIVGGICAALHNIILIAGDMVGSHYVVSSLVSFCVVASAGYILHSKFTFRNELEQPSFLRYTLGMAANVPLSIGALFILVDLMSMPVWLAAPISTVFLIAWNFAATRWALVRRPA